METYEKKSNYDVESILKNIEEVSNVQKLVLDEYYFEEMKDKLQPEIFESILSNYNLINAYKFNYPSDGLSIEGFIWTPKDIKEPLPLIIWNRGGTGSLGSNKETQGRPYVGTPCDFAKLGMVVVGSDYRSGVGLQDKDEYGGNDLDDVINIKKITDKLSFLKHEEKVIVAGVSRGGMMNYLLAKNEPWVKAVITLSGLADLEMTTEKRPEMKEMFESKFGFDKQDMQKRSATYFYNEIPKDLPMLILQGDNDERVDVEQARKLKELLQSSGHNVEYHEFYGGEHDLAGPTSNYRQEVLKIIDEFVQENK